MQLKVLVTALTVSVTLLMAGAASAGDEEGLLDGVFLGTDDKNPNISVFLEVLSPFVNDVVVAGICESSTGNKVRFLIDADSRPTKTTITGTKATIDKNRKEEPAQVWGQLPGLCETTTIQRCFEGGDIDCPGEPCINVGVPELLDCETARVKATANANSETLSWQGQAKKCGPIDAALLGAVDAICGKNGPNNKGINVSVKDTMITNLKINGKEKD
jgi:hypothetical protein